MLDCVTDGLMRCTHSGLYSLLRQNINVNRPSFTKRNPPTLRQEKLIIVTLWVSRLDLITKTTVPSGPTFIILPMMGIVIIGGFTVDCSLPTLIIFVLVSSVHCCNIIYRLLSGKDCFVDSVLSLAL